MAEHLVEVENLKMYFNKVSGIIRRKTEYVKAVDNISCTIDRGETFGLVGESRRQQGGLSSGFMTQQAVQSGITARILPT